ncbi:MAG: hypothetical protein K0S74_655 [Chlamydiales bacterium]|jgi:RND family efflux transporter MFP subunit|nr:hypothetical protein [Chlamydiales bacterium]
MKQMHKDQLYKFSGDERMQMEYFHPFHRAGFLQISFWQDLLNFKLSKVYRFLLNIGLPVVPLALLCYMTPCIALENTIPSSPVASLIEKPAKEHSFRVVLTPLHTTTVRTKVPSKVVYIHKQMGESFEKDEVLVQLEDTLFIAEKNRAQAIFEKFKSVLNAKQELYRSSIASLSDLKEAEASLVSSERDLIAAMDALDSCKFKAPYIGSISAVHIKEFELVQPGDPIVELVDDHILLAKFLLPSHYFNQVKKGQKIEISVQETFTKEIGTVTQIDAVIDPASSVFRVYAEIDNSDKHLMSGMRADIILKPAPSNLASSR